eukprot:5870612-Ditylum_brightwellii.AAC.1
MALAKGSKLNGAKIFEGVVVEGVSKTRHVDNNSTNNKKKNLIPRVTGVTVQGGHEIEANVVVNCAGMWARQFGEKCG